MTAKEHYDNHLAHFYSWMAGDFESKKIAFKKILTDNNIKPLTNKVAIDLGAGHGLQSIPLAEMGFKVLAVDFNEQLINELKFNAHNLPITTTIDDIKNIANFVTDQPELIACCGDTLAHLDNKEEIEKFISEISTALAENGKFILSFRDYSIQLTDTSRFIPVKSDEERILTCILDFEEEFVRVTDLLHEKTSSGWTQKVSSYKKVRILTNEIVTLLAQNNFEITFNDVINRMTTIVAIKTTKNA